MLMKKRYIVCIGELTENQVEIGKYLPAKEDQCANDIEGSRKDHAQIPSRCSLLGL